MFVYDTRPAMLISCCRPSVAHADLRARARLAPRTRPSTRHANERAAHRSASRGLHSERQHQECLAEHYQKNRWFKNAQKWRTGVRAVIVVNGGNGRNRSRYKGEAGMKRWVVLGVIETT